MDDFPQQTRRRLLGITGSIGLLASVGCLRLRNETGTETEPSSDNGASETGLETSTKSDTSPPETSSEDGSGTTPSETTSADTDATSDGTSTASEQSSSLRAVSYDWDSSSELDDWQVESTGDAFTEVSDGRLHQHVTNCEDTSAELSLGVVDGPFTIEIDWLIEWASSWGERANLYVTVDGTAYLPEESKKSRQEKDWFELRWHHETEGGDRNDSGQYELQYPKTVDEGFGGEATLTIATERSDNCAAGDHSDTDLYVDSVTIRP